MKKTLVLMIAIAIVTTFSMISISGCTDGQMGKYRALGNQHKIEVFSGGVMVKEYTSTGRPQSEANSDGYYFTDVKTKRLMEVSGTVIIEMLP